MYVSVCMRVCVYISRGTFLHRKNDEALAASDAPEKGATPTHTHTHVSVSVRACGALEEEKVGWTEPRKGGLLLMPNRIAGPERELASSLFRSLPYPLRCSRNLMAARARGYRTTRSACSCFILCEPVIRARRRLFRRAERYNTFWPDLRFYNSLSCDFAVMFV